MNRFRSHLVALVSVAALSLLAGASTAAAEMGTPRTPNAGFDLMKSLVGEWTGAPAADGKSSSATYTLVSGGTALLEMLNAHDESMSMVTVYHPDGQSLLMTHYCGANNQPRMRCAKPAAGAKSLVFEYVDCSNLPTSKTGHMNHLVITFVDPDHMTQAWTWKEGSKTGTETFQFERKKS